MIHIPAMVLSAIIALTPVIGALCADGCVEREAARAAEVAPACGHGDASSSSPSLSAAACAVDDADVALAEVRTVGPALAPAVSVTITAPERLRLPSHERYLQHQPPPPPAGVTLRI